MDNSDYIDPDDWLSEDWDDDWECDVCGAWNDLEWCEWCDEEWEE